MVLPAAPPLARSVIASNSAREPTISAWSINMMPSDGLAGRRVDHPLERYLTRRWRVEFPRIAVPGIDRMGDEARCQAIADPGHGFDSRTLQGIGIGLQGLVQRFLRQAGGNAD